MNPGYTVLQFSYIARPFNLLHYRKLNPGKVLQHVSIHSSCGLLDQSGSFVCSACARQFDGVGFIQTRMKIGPESIYLINKVVLFVNNRNGKVERRKRRNKKEM